MECPRYDTTTSSSEAPILDIWGEWGTSLLPFHPGSLCPKVVVPFRVSFIGQIDSVFKLFISSYNHMQKLKKLHKNIDINVQ